MSALRPFHPLDLLKFNLTNLDSLTETYDISFYLSYLARWPSLFNVIEGANGEINAYSTVFPFSFPRLGSPSLPTSHIPQIPHMPHKTQTLLLPRPHHNHHHHHHQKQPLKRDPLPNPTISPAAVMGKLESSPPFYRHSPHYLPWHAHVTALTVAPSARRLGLARLLTSSLERAGDLYDAWFVDLFVRESNAVAIGMYKGLGYSVFRKVLNYYSDDPTGRADGEHAFDMRKPLKRDKARKHVRERGEEHMVFPQDVW